MTEPDLFLAAQAALGHVVTQISNEQWDEEVPPGMSARQPSASLRQIINYHAYDNAWVPDTLHGKTIAEVGDTYDGDLLGENPKANFARIAQAATNAVRHLKDEDMTKTAHLSYGDFPITDYLTHISIFAGLRSYDIAKFIGADPTLPTELVQGLWDAIEPQAEDLRAMGVFGSLIDIPVEADLQSRLLGLTGRQP